MNFLDRFSYVQELRRVIERQDKDIAGLRCDLVVAREDIRRLIDSIAQSKQFLAPFSAIKAPPNDWAAMRRVSISREIQKLEAEHNTKPEDE